MTGQTSALYSEYIIDGQPESLSPARILEECLAPGAIVPPAPLSEPEAIVDETLDPAPSSMTYSENRIDDYLERTVKMRGRNRSFLLNYPPAYTRSLIAGALIDSLWLKGHYRLADLALRASWKWNPAPLGNMAAFHSSVEAAADYIDSLGLVLSGYGYSETGGDCEASFKVLLGNDGARQDADELDEDEEKAVEGVMMSRRLSCRDRLVADGESWIAYIPFDSCDFRLGGSLLAESFGSEGSVFPAIDDPDYFVDCYEVVRELVEDGVVMSAATVGSGGLLTALHGMGSSGVGCRIDVNDVMKSYRESGMVRVLFSEVPGVLIQISDGDYDYVDAEMLLQDVAWYPLGHPVPGNGSIKVVSGGERGIAGILQSLMDGQASEGED